MSEPGSYTVIAVREGKVKPNPHGGQLQAFYVDFEGAADVYWQRQAANAPELGGIYYGRIVDGDYGPRFKQEQRPDSPGRVTPDSSGPQTPANTTAARSGGTSSGPHADPSAAPTPDASAKSADSAGPLSKDDYWRNKDRRDVESQGRMGRAHAQEMALRWLAISLKPGDPLGLEDEVRHATDWFHQDVQRFPLAADSSEIPVSGTSQRDVTPAAPSDSAPRAVPATPPANPNPASAAQKRLITTLLKQTVHGGAWDALRERVTSSGEASRLITLLKDTPRKELPAAIQATYGIAVPSEDPAPDLDGLPSAEGVEAQAEALGLTVHDDNDIPF